jgi:hypothetical protein
VHPAIAKTTFLSIIKGIKALNHYIVTANKTIINLINRKVGREGNNNEQLRKMVYDLKKYREQEPG